MTKKEYCLHKMEELVKAKHKKQKEEIQSELDRIFNESQQDWCEAYDEALYHTRAIAEGESIKQKLAPVLKIVSAKYIAETYFHRSSSWLSQRINGHKVAGAVATFKSEELKQFEDAVHDIGKKLLEFHVE